MKTKSKVKYPTKEDHPKKTSEKLHLNTDFNTAMGVLTGTKKPTKGIVKTYK